MLLVSSLDYEKAKVILVVVGACVGGEVVIGAAVVDAVVKKRYYFFTINIFFSKLRYLNGPIRSILVVLFTS